MNRHSLDTLAEATINALRARNWRMATAESCTGGLIAAAITDVPGSSDVLDCGFVTYSNAAKTRLLSIPPEVLDEYGAVSTQVAKLMAEGAIVYSEADIAVSATGIAGPGGGSAHKPVGLVHIGLCVRGEAPVATSHHFPGDRQSIRGETVGTALHAILNRVHTAVA